MPDVARLNRTQVSDCRRALRQMRRDGLSVQMCVTSSPYFRLRSYLPPGHPDKATEIGLEPTPATFIPSLVLNRSFLDHHELH
ncbi:hypothetical protein LDO31_17855 [Luteimonas sp. XNQY3]|nr:hypothetical protein [Luteimonas sp. XNQY3]MCD9008065.1 hypothetical protein [Luteimonas sp. XNQY3]